MKIFTMLLLLLLGIGLIIMVILIKGTETPYQYYHSTACSESYSAWNYSNYIVPWNYSRNVTLPVNITTIDENTDYIEITPNEDIYIYNGYARYSFIYNSSITIYDDAISIVNIAGTIVYSSIKTGHAFNCCRLSPNTSLKLGDRWERTWNTSKFNGEFMGKTIVKFNKSNGNVSEVACYPNV